MGTETDIVTEGVVASGVITEEATVSNGELSCEQVTDVDGSLIEDKLEDDVGLLIEEGTRSEELVDDGEICSSVHEISDNLIKIIIREVFNDQKLF